jgi:N6-adenosine-specific RNA methylase IME4
VTPGALTNYDAARQALAEARRFDEVREIADKAAAIMEYARRAKNHDMEIDAAEIRIRAERRYGELLAELKAEGLFGKGRTRSVDPDRHLSDSAPGRVTLDEMGVTRDFSSKCQRLAALAPDRFEAKLGEWRERFADDSARVTASLVKEAERVDEREAFAQRTADGCTVDDLAALAASGARFGAILADPPWEYITYSERGQDRGAARHYKIQTLDDILAMPVEPLAARDCVLFLWTSGPFVPAALRVIEAWGFTYKTLGLDWLKTTGAGAPAIGGGHWTRATNELCFLATRGHPARLNADVAQAIVAERREHSRKPDETHERVERLVAGPYLELYARRLRRSWTCWGNEIARDDLAAPPAAGEASEAAGAVVDGEPAWWAEARRLRAGGARLIDIAHALGRSTSSVVMATDESGKAHAARNARARRIRQEGGEARSSPPRATNGHAVFAASSS